MTKRNTEEKKKERTRETYYHHEFYKQYRKGDKEEKLLAVVFNGVQSANATPCNPEIQRPSHALTRRAIEGKRRREREEEMRLIALQKPCKNKRKWPGLWKGNGGERT